MRMRGKTGTICLAAMFILQGIFTFPATSDSADNTQKVRTALSDTSYSSTSYEDYLCQVKCNDRPNETIIIDALKYTDATAHVEAVSEMDEITGKQKYGLLCGDSGTVGWSFTVKKSGMYTLSVEYFNHEDSGNDIERSLFIDNKIPYNDAGNLVFSRTWRDKGEKEYNSGSGNEIRRSQEEVHIWTDVLLNATTGYHDGDLLFFLSEGKHKLSLKSVNECIVFGSFTFSNSEEPHPYNEVLTEYKKRGYKKVCAGQDAKVQGEDAAYKSSATLYAVQDCSSSLNEPYDMNKILLNCIGGTTWKYQGAWIEWQIDAPKSGLYEICIRAKQNYSSGISYTKTLAVDGKVPFAEAKNIAFRYNSDWQIVTPEDDDNNPALIYLTEGTHTLRLTNTLGRLGDLLRRIEESSQTLSILYRKVCMVVGTSVDANRDYELEKYIPNLIETIKTENKFFKTYIKEMEELAGTVGEQTISLQQVQSQLSYYIDHQKKIPSKISGLSDCISSLASWITTVTNQSVLIDYIALHSPSSKPLIADSGFLGKILTELRSYINSFFSKYTLVEKSNVDATGSTVSLWLSNAIGRDQANIIKQLAQSSFTQETGNALDIRLVDMTILLRAVAAGNGPDVGIYIDQATPINYGIRSALQDLTVFDDLDDVLTRFDDGAIIPFKFNGAVYALPETETFLMMFVRTDIMNDLQLKVPKTWDDLYDIVPTLNRNYYDVSLPSPLVGGETVSTGLNTMFSTLLLQKNLAIYNDKGSRCVLNSASAVDTFISWSEMYTKYRFPKTTDAITYFRIGTAPIVFNTFNFYNTLIVGAPEIRGMWEMYKIPGTCASDGTINNKVAAHMTGCIMFANAVDKQASWKFLKWWTSDQIQSEYAKEIEALQGKSGRWMTANKNAMTTIGWSSEDMQKINDGLKNAYGIPEVAGGYYVGRSVDNAIKSVINSDKPPRETMLNYVDDINIEIISKRSELGLE